MELIWRRPALEARVGNWWPDLRERRLVGELMDDPALPAVELDRALRGLERLNRVSASWRVFTPVLREMCEQSQGPIQVLDVASGGGDNVAALMQWALKQRLPIAFHACDMNPAMVARSLAAMRRIDSKTPESASFVCDIVRGGLANVYDIVINSLFLHHLSRDEGAAALSAMHKAASRALVVSDLARSRWNWAQVLIASRVLTGSRVVRIDAMRSIEAAWTKDELKTLAVQAGITAGSVRVVHPARMVLSVFKAEAARDRRGVA